MSGVAWAGLAMTVLPAASAGAILDTQSTSGTFHGMMAATTPTGSSTVYVCRSSLMEIVSPRMFRALPA